MKFMRGKERERREKSDFLFISLSMVEKPFAYQRTTCFFFVFFGTKLEADKTKTTTTKKKLKINGPSILKSALSLKYLKRNIGIVQW